MPQSGSMTNDSSLHTQLIAGFTVKDYREAVSRNERTALGEFLIKRFEERYFLPMDVAASAKHGFLLLSLSCMVIETLEAFYQGLPDTRGRSGRMFLDFFQRNHAFEVFTEGADSGWFFSDIRCGLLHQGETRGGWRIRRSGPLLNKKERVINANLFVKKLREVVSEHAMEMERNDNCWRNFLTKMEAVCNNCCAT